MFASENSPKLKIDLAIQGNKRDSRTDWEDARNKIERTCNIKLFLAGAVGSIIPWSIVPDRKREQERGINMALNVLVEMAGSPTVRTVIRNIENDRLTDPPILAEDVDKIRQIVHYYDQLTMDNNTKDTELLRLLQGIKFESTGRTNLAVDVVTYFEKIAKNQNEMQAQHRMSNFRSVEMCSSHLVKEIPSLRSPMSNLRLMDMTFAQLRDGVDEICQNIEVHKGHHHDNDISSNSTMSSSSSEKEISMTPSRLRDVVMNAVKETRNGKRSSHYGPSREERRNGRSQSKSPSRLSRSPGRYTRSSSNDKRGNSYSNKKGKHVSINSTQVAGAYSDDDGTDDDNAIVDSAIGSCFDAWNSK